MLGEALADQSSLPVLALQCLREVVLADTRAVDAALFLRSLLSTCIQRHELTVLGLTVYMMLDTGEDELRVQQILFGEASTFILDGLQLVRIMISGC